MGRPASMFFWKGRGFATDAGGRRTVLVKGPKTNANRQRALRVLADHLASLECGAPSVPAVAMPRAPSVILPIAEIIDLFLADCAARIRAGDLKEMTHSSYYQPYLTLVKKALGAQPVGRLTRAVLLDYRGQLVSRGLAHNTIKNYFDTFRSCLAWAEETGVIPAGTSPTFPSMPRRRRETLPTEEQVNALLSASPEPIRDVLQSLLEIAVRPGDIFGLRADWVDLTQGVLRLGDSKTGPRVVFITPKVRAILERRLQLDATKRTGFVYTAAQGGRWHHRYFGQKVREIRQKACLPAGLCAYALRHRWTTTALLRGLDLATVRALRGDKDPRTIFVYEHLSQVEGHLQAAALKAVWAPVPAAPTGTREDQPHGS